MEKEEQRSLRMKDKAETYRKSGEGWEVKIDGSVTGYSGRVTGDICVCVTKNGHRFHMTARQ